MFVNFKEQEVESSQEAPFKGDKLARQPLIEQLTQLTKSLGQTGCVLAIDGQWGVGKTTFVKMWNNYVKSENIKGRALYFNAWESDFVDDPLIALIGELKEIFPNHPQIENLVKSGGKVVARFAGELVKGSIKKFTGIDENGISAISASVDELTDIFKEKIDSYDKDKKNLSEFKRYLVEFAASNSENYPIVFFIDELDRCNPHYAVKVLERIKHLFDVPNIVFVLSVNLDQLQYAVQGFYGSALIDGKNYLKRFIDLQISLPEPDINKYVNILYETHRFGRHFIAETHKDSSAMVTIAKDLFKAANTDLRSINKIMAFTRLSLDNFIQGVNIDGALLFLLCYLRSEHDELYTNLKNGAYSIQEALNALEENLPKNLLIQTSGSCPSRQIAFSVAALLLRYNYTPTHSPKDPNFKGVKLEDNSFWTFPLTPRFINPELLNQALEWNAQYHEAQFDYQEGLKSFFEHIDFLDNVIF